MDSRRPQYPPPPVPAPPPPAPQHPSHAHHQQQPLPPHAHAHHHHQQQQQQPPTPVDNRPPPPPPHFAQHANHQPPPPITPQAAPQHAYGPPPPQHPPPGPSLPPIQQSYGQPAPPHDSQSLPPFRHPSHHAHDPPREGQDHYAYSQHNRSGHATPAPINRTYSHDSTHQQRTPTTPAHPGAYPPATATDGSQPLPPPQHMEHAHHPYPPTNGVPHGLPPPQHQQGPLPPPPPQQQHHEAPPPQHYMTPGMENHHSYGPPPPAAPPSSNMYSQAPNYGPTSVSVYGAQRKKQMRATQACEQCRQRKQKCDEGTPCSFCKENNLVCNYRDTPPAKTDKNMEKVLSMLEQQAASMEQQAADMRDLKRRFDDLEGNQPRAPRVNAVAGAEVASGEAEPAMGEEVTRRKPLLEDHRTAPHKLILLWPSVGPLLQEAHVNVSDSYVMEAEDRGVLRIYTRGEGIDEHDGTQAGGPASPARSEDSGEGSAPTPPEGLWGTGFPQTPNSEIRRSEPIGVGGLKPDGSLDLDVPTVNMLYESYIKHMHVMHPFLDRQRLRKLFDSFIKRYCTGHPNLRHKFAVGGPDAERPLKRQRSNGSTAINHDGSAYRQELTERSPGNAIVWLVLALGKICTYKDPLPGTVPDGRINTNILVSHQLTGNPGMTGSSPVTGHIKPSPMSPKSTPNTHPTPPTMDGIRMESRSRRSSFDGPPATGARNIDVIPGLAYFAKAAEILGDQGDGNDLVHAQMFLLAGLYKGQLARVKESMSWLMVAGRAIRNLLDRYKLYNEYYWTGYGDVRIMHEKGQARIKDKRHNLIVLASWTCLQLESDILAELRLPSSGIQDIENLLLMPHNMSDDERENYDSVAKNGASDGIQESYGDILLYYTAQMFLRKRLNQVHQEMYGDQSLNQTLNQVREMLNGHENILGLWREGLPDKLQWSDDDEPAKDILNARLRAKFWGARYVINRPFLDYALHIMPHTRAGKSVEEVAKDVHGNPRDKAEIHLFKAIQLMNEGEIWAAVQRCIGAAMQSTVALDRVPERLIVTNIHGTAHAQFGNMLVLAASFHNPYLKQLVPKERFRQLIERTILFLRRLAPISPTCWHDCSILERINNLLFAPPMADSKSIYHNEGYEPQSATTSFGDHST